MELHFTQTTINLQYSLKFAILQDTCKILPTWCKIIPTLLLYRSKNVGRVFYHVVSSNMKSCKIANFRLYCKFIVVFHLDNLFYIIICIYVINTILYITKTNSNMIKTIYNAINIKAIKMQFFSVKRVLADFSNEKVDMNRI